MDLFIARELADEATQWDIDSERYAGSIESGDHDVHDQDGWFACCGMTREEVVAELAEAARQDELDQARRSAEAAAEAAAVAAGDLPW